MDLSEFVKETVVQIARGIEAANSELSSMDAMINPLNVNAYSANTQAYARTSCITAAEAPEGSRVVEKVTFDVAVTVQESDTKEGGGKLSIASFGLRADAKSESSNQTESRVGFSIPIVYPGVNNTR